MMAFSSIADVVADILDVPKQQVDYCVVVCFVCFIVLNFVAVYALESNNGKGLGYCFKIFSVVTVLGAWTKFVALYYFDNNFYVLLGGQVLIGISQPFFANAIGKIPTIWFPEHQRAMATSFGALS
jgi:hypothetical protein